jgi:hypothetical protein
MHLRVEVDVDDPGFSSPAGAICFLETKLMQVAYNLMVIG